MLIAVCCVFKIFSQIAVVCRSSAEETKDDFDMIEGTRKASHAYQTDKSIYLTSMCSCAFSVV